MLRSLAAAVLLAIGLSSGAVAQTPYTDAGLLISSARNGYGYAYAPTIVHDRGTYHMMYCSYGRIPDAWDYVRYSTSTDGQTWSPPTIVLNSRDPVGERAACDPSLVRYKAPNDARPYWYLFYSGNELNVQTLMFVARAEEIGGPYLKWTRRETWEEDAPDPQAIIRPLNPKPEKTPFYGAGQQSVVVERGRLVGWYTDDTTCGATACLKLFRTETRDPTRWPRGRETNVATPSIDVKRDGTGGYVMIGIESQHTADTTLSLRRSRDGITWSEPEIVCGVGCFPPYTHNAGISGTASGGPDPSPPLVAYGGPLDRDTRCGTCWAKWDIFGGVLDLGPP